MERIGFVGVGLMGGAIAVRMVANDIPILAYDSNPTTLALMESKGASVAGSPCEVADQVETVFVCLPTAEICNAVAFGPDGLAGGAKIRRYVEVSTMGGTAAANLSDALSERGITMLDCPVIGGVPALDAGTIGVLAAGPKEVFDRVRPALDSFAGRVFYLGERAGMAQVAKVLNNAVAHSALLASFEAFSLGLKAGIDMASLAEIMNQGSGTNFYTQRMFPGYIIPRKFEGTAAVEVVVKDMKLYLEEAQRLQAESPMGQSVSTLLKRVADSGAAGRDTMTMFHYFTDLAGVPRQG